VSSVSLEQIIFEATGERHEARQFVFEIEIREERRRDKRRIPRKIRRPNREPKDA
jgi:hypothetical protein